MIKKSIEERIFELSLSIAKEKKVKEQQEELYANEVIGELERLEKTLV